MSNIKTMTPIITMKHECKLDSKLLKNIEEEMDNISITKSKKEEFLKTVIKFINNRPINSLNFLESSGSSVVILSPDVEYVCQYYVNIDIYNKIFSLFNDINKYEKATESLVRKDESPLLTSMYIVEPIFFSEDNKSIYWKKIITLNSFSNLKEYILKNIEKLIYDITIALNLIHNSGYVHGDCSIDNIGINEYGNFCLFDFDSSSKITQEKSSNDFRILYKSIDFHTECYSRY